MNHDYQTIVLNESGPKNFRYHAKHLKEEWGTTYYIATLLLEVSSCI